MPEKASQNYSTESKLVLRPTLNLYEIDPLAEIHQAQLTQFPLLSEPSIKSMTDKIVFESTFFNFFICP